MSIFLPNIAILEVIKRMNESFSIPCSNFDSDFDYDNNEVINTIAEMTIFNDSTMIMDKKTDKEIQLNKYYKEYFYSVSIII